MLQTIKGALSFQDSGPALAKFKLFCSLVKIEHSVFALPFAYLGLFAAAKGWPGWRAFLFLALAMVAVRSFAMAVNRLADLPYDRINPRTQERELVRGVLGIGETWAFTAACAVIFVLACWGLNRVCLMLSPVALVWAALYSFTKRFTWLCHLFLGSVLGLAPLAGWLAYQGTIAPAAFLFALGVTCWVAGFDVLYSCQDVEFDRANGLRAAPVRFGLGKALTLAARLHAGAAVLFALAGWAAGLGLGYFICLIFTAVVLVVEHRLVSENDLSRINTAFFTLNGVVAASLFLGALVDLFWLK
ncbi:UbiA-like polyprenyltransferase [Fundidesulfovibrio butyratiphilus]